MRVFAVVALAAVAAQSAWAAEGTFERTLKVNGPVLLGVDTGSGNIRVTAGPVDSVHIIGHVHSGSGGLFGGGDSGSAEDRVKRVVQNPPLNVAGNIISLGHNFRENNISIDYEITAPRGTDLRADSASGDVRVSDLGGPVELKTGSGNVEASGLSDRVSLETGSGEIKAAMLSARDVKAQTGSGNITLSNVQSGLWAETGSGNLQVSGKPLAGWRLEAGSGNVTADTGGAAMSLNATTGSGDLHYDGTLAGITSTRDRLAGNANGGGPVVRINTGSGDVRVK